MSNNPYTLHVFTISSTWQGRYDVPAGIISNPYSVSSTFRWAGRGVCQIVLRGDDVNIPLMDRHDAWVAVYYRGKLEMTGKVRTRAGGFLPSDYRTYQVRDDTALTDDTICWVRPVLFGGGGLRNLQPAAMNDTGQWWGTPAATGDLTGTSGYFDWTSNWGQQGIDANIVNGLPTSTESALRKLFMLQVNKEISNRGWLEDSDQQRGVAITSASQLPAVRFDKLSVYMDKIIAGTDVSYQVMRRSGGGNMVLVIRQAGVWPGVLTAESGVIAKGSWQQTEPSATRAYVGGPGDLAARLFHEVIQQPIGSLGVVAQPEVDYFWTAEVFREATGVELKWPSGLADNLKTPAFYMARSDVSSTDKATVRAALAAAGQDALDGAQAQTSVQVELSETEGFHYGGPDGIQLGDKVKLKLPSGGTLDDQLTEVGITYSKDGVKVTPKVGEFKDDPDRRLWDAIAAIAAAQRKLSASR
jgi:hypothetical protein